MAKMIKFDLPINGVKIKNIDELQDNFTAEIIEHARSGKLTKWLLSRDENELAENIKQALLFEDDFQLFVELAKIFDMDADEDILQDLYDEKSNNTNTVNSANQANGFDLYDFFSSIIHNFLNKDTKSFDKAEHMLWLNNELSLYCKDKEIKYVSQIDDELNLINDQYQKVSSALGELKDRFEPIIDRLDRKIKNMHIHRADIFTITKDYFLVSEAYRDVTTKQSYLKFIDPKSYRDDEADIDELREFCEIYERNINK